MKSNMVALIACCFFITGCFIANNLIEEFRRVNASLEKSNTILISENEKLINDFSHQKGLKVILAAEIDSVHYLDLNACYTLGIMKNDLQKSDSVGDNVNIPKEGLVDNGAGLVLQKKITALYNYASMILVYQKRISLNDSSITALRSVAKDTGWVRKNFNGAPTMAAVAALSKYQNDCLLVEKQCLNHLKFVDN